MSKQQTESTSSVSDGGIAAKHVPLEQQQAFVAPATATEHNTLKAGIIPIACWRVEDFRFAFDSSVVTPEIDNELKLLAQLMRSHPPASKSEGKPGHPLSVFGHADPTGNDDYNKQLSGRRATAIYALLTRDTNLWEKLFSQPFGNDKWGTKALELMLDAVSPATPGQTNHEQAVEHERNAGRRKGLFTQYMEKLCGAELKLQRRDFLGNGDDTGGKGDFQGCSEFNPVLIFSEQEQKKFERDKDKTARNEANKTNRRVVVLIFRKGSRVTSSKWPCPRVNEGVAGCKKRFWSDGERRRSERLPDKHRKFEESRNTFACRFYQRLTDNSPCEREVKTFQIRLYDGFGRFIPSAPFEVTIGSQEPFTGRADERGILFVRDVLTPAKCEIKWGFPPAKGESPLLDFSMTMFLTASATGEDDATRAEEAREKLNNLGYDTEDLSDKVIAFQLDYGHLKQPRLTPTGVLDNATLDLLREIHDRSEDDLRNRK